METDLTSPVGSQIWRLNNLYHIIDESGQDSLFRMRPAQRAFFDSLNYYNIILKARQLGFTTLIDLIGLDMVIFRANLTAVIIAETKDKAADIFQRKVVYPYERLPKELRDWCPVVSQSADGVMQFGNGSEIKVMTSARSGTCQFLHVSEYGPICAMAPAKGLEIMTGSLPAVHSGGFCFIESTAKSNSGPFFDLVQRAKPKFLQAQVDPESVTWGRQEFKLHFYPWWRHPEYVTEPADVAIPARLASYFDDLYTRQGICLTEGQMAWYATQDKVYHEEMWREYPSYVDEAFKVAQDGSFYGRCFNGIYRDHRITTVPYDPGLPVYTGWDLGVSDDTAIWFLQFIGREVRVIDYYENSGEGLAHYAQVLQERGYRYGGHFAPHDIAVRELGSGVSRLETARKYGISFERIPTNLDVMGGIEACREMLAYCWFDEGRTEQGRKALERYRKEWDERHNCFKTRPLHDDSSHGADAFRTIGMAWKMGRCSAPGDAARNSFKVTGGLRKI